MQGRAQLIAYPALQCRPLVSSSKAQTCCPLVNVDELTRVLIDACCTQVATLTAEVLDRCPPNLYEMYTFIATLNVPRKD